MKRGMGDGNAAYLNRPKNGDGRKRASAADLNLDIFNDGGRFFGRKFIGNGLARSFADYPAGFKNFIVINNDDNAVNFVDQLFTIFSLFDMKFKNFFKRMG